MPSLLRCQERLEKMERKRSVLLFHLFFLSILLLVGRAFGSGFTTDSSEQQEKDRVTDLPGISFNVSFAHYAGYVNVNEKSGRWLFYWFFEAAEDPSSKPLIIWLEGGPGCSGIAYGEATQLGPLHVNPDWKTLRLNPYSWNQVANIIFLDSPVGTGFSYSNTPSDEFTNGDKRTVEDLLAFLRNWFERFPQYKGRDFYITGESYAGHFVPQLAQAIVRYQQSTSDRSINLKGILAGNPLTNDFNDHIGYAQFLWSVGLISDQTYKNYKRFCPHMSFQRRFGQCLNTTNVVFSELGGIDRFSIFTPPCTRNISNFNGFMKEIPKIGLLDNEYDPCTVNYGTIYFNLPEVQEALHVRPGPDAAPVGWSICSGIVFAYWRDSASSVLDIYHELISLGLRTWIYSGNADGVIPITSTRYNIDALKLPTASNWRAWYVEGQVGGWTQEYVGLNFASVRGAGHFVIQTRPKQALVLFKSFLSGSPLPSL